jgi:hypothetical protein
MERSNLYLCHDAVNDGARFQTDIHIDADQWCLEQKNATRHNTDQRKHRPSRSNDVKSLSQLQA